VILLKVSHTLDAKVAVSAIVKDRVVSELLVFQSITISSSRSTSRYTIALPDSRISSSNLRICRHDRDSRQGVDRILVDVLESCVSGNIHQDVKLSQQTLHDMLDSRATCNREGPDPESTKKNELRTNRQRFEDICSTTDPRVECNLIIG
jgi:hypothetical protein